MVPLKQLVPAVPFTSLGILPGEARCQDVLNDENEFGATVVGYGHSSLTGWLFGGSATGSRRSRLTDDWERATSGERAVYRNFFPLTVTYGGALKGDSGGGLFYDAGAGPVLCGINSLFRPDVDLLDPGLKDLLLSPTGILGGGPGITSFHAAVDSPAAVAFLKEQTVDAYGRYIGTCNVGPVQARSIDSDNDLIPDACDPCPRVADMGYRLLHSYASQFDTSIDANLDGVPDNDADHDGVPNQCDNCPGTPNPHVWNGSALVQADADADGLGDACDPCNSPGGVREIVCCTTNADCAGTVASGALATATPTPGASGSACFPVTPGAYPIHPAAASCTGRCGTSLDFDSDGVPDLCDNCPQDQNGAQADFDQDGVGIGCDMARGKRRSLAPERGLAHPRRAVPRLGVSPFGCCIARRIAGALAPTGARSR